jgi:hypothetical protein
MGIKSTSDIFFIISVTAALMAVLSWALRPETIWLAASQWLLIAITVGIWGLYLRVRDIHEMKGNGKRK